MNQDLPRTRAAFDGTILIPIQASLRHHREIKIESEPNIVLLLVRVLTCVVLVLIVCVKLQVSADGEQATREEIRGAPLVVLALLIGFSGNIRN